MGVCDGCAWLPVATGVGAEGVADGVGVAVGNGVGVGVGVGSPCRSHVIETSGEVTLLPDA